MPDEKKPKERKKNVEPEAKAAAAEKPVAAAAGKKAPPAEVAAPAAPRPQTKSQKIPKLQKKNKARLPRRQKKALQKAALAKDKA
jgi:hypothetical protein